VILTNTDGDEPGVAMNLFRFVKTIGFRPVLAGNLLPMGLSEGCRLRRDVPMDSPITRGDVELPEGRLCDALRAEQDVRFDHVPVQQ
jgi:predicted homoserine dehydrogenase-like protein